MKKVKNYIYISPILLILIISIIMFIFMGNNNSINSASSVYTCKSCGEGIRDAYSMGSAGHRFSCPACGAVSETMSHRCPDSIEDHSSSGKCADCLDTGCYTLNYSAISDNQHRLTCSSCSASMVESHDWELTETTKQPTCLANGVGKWTCKDCKTTTTQPIQALGHTGGTHANGGKCTRTGCGVTYQTHEISYSSVSDSTHRVSCSTCGTLETKSCNFELKETTSQPTCTSNGYGKHVCSDCNNTRSLPISPLGHTGGTHSNGGKCTRSGCGQVYQTHTNTYTPVTGSTHKINCSTCGTVKTENCNFGSTQTITNATCTTGGTEKAACSKCSNSKTTNTEPLGHTGGTHANAGKCTRSGCGQTYQVHSPVTSECTYQTNEYYHKAIYKCSSNGCTESFEGSQIGHTFENPEIIKEATCTENGTKKSTCVCGVIKRETIEKVAHTGGTHENGGVCTREGCGQAYEDHEIFYRSIPGGMHQVVCPTCDIMGTDYCNRGAIMSQTFSTCTSSGSVVYACTYCYDSETVYTPALGHTGGTHENGGKCTRSGCNQIYQNHQTTYRNVTDGTHELFCSECGVVGTEGCDYNVVPTTKEPTCTEAGAGEHTCKKCNDKITQTIAPLGHTGGTHANGGKCTRTGCGQTYQNHSATNTLDHYEKNDSYHKPIYKCSYTGCTEGYEGTQETHTFSSWTTTEEATCVSNGMKTATCICEHTKTEGIPALGHTGATHTNGGKCTRTGCGEVYENHQNSNNIVKYNNTSEGHIAVYACSNSECTETYLGELESHNIGSYTDTGKGTHKGSCSVCSYELVAQHNYVEDTCEDCGAVKQGSTEVCTHTYVAKHNETHHWEECSNCEIIKPNSEANHDYEYERIPLSTARIIEYEDGKHLAKCKICEYSKTENCNYEDDTCKNCGSTKPEEEHECEHEWEFGIDKEYHWKQCSKCNVTEENSKEKHTGEEKCDVCGVTLNNDGDDNDDNNNNNNNNNNDNNNNNNKDDDTTIKDGVLPETGIRTIVIRSVLVLLVIGGIVSAKKFISYRDVK